MVGRGRQTASVLEGTGGGKTAELEEEAASSDEVETATEGVLR